jgi:hypothetical protein
MKKLRQGYLNRSKLPTSESYFSKRGFVLEGRSDWKKTKCPFHDDFRPSLCINLKQGGRFKCHACGASGRDIIAFHQKHRDMSFIEAVKDLGAWEVK